jgi:hypothetical protein
MGRKETITMTPAQLDCQIARITGESLQTLRFMGFSLLPQKPGDLPPENLRLVLDCPFCGRPVPYPGPASSGSEVLAECEACDVYFGFDLDEVYSTARDGGSTTSRITIE